jgi:MFS family permease
MTDADTNLKRPIVEGMFSSVMAGAGEAYLSAYAIFLGATALEAGLVTGLPPLIGSLILLNFIDRIVQTKTRAGTLFKLSATQAILWIPIALLFMLAEGGKSAILALITLTIAHYSINAVIGPLWNALMGDIIPASIRGSYFGNRNRIALLSTMISTLLAGATLQYCQNRNITEIGYLSIFLIAGLARLISATLLNKYPDVPVKIDLGEKFTFKEFLKRSHRSNFLKFSVFVGIYNLTIFVSTPYIAYYLLEDLQYTYVEFTLAVSISTFSQLLTMQRWGQLADEYGTKKILIVSSVGYALSEFLWLFSANFWYILFIRAISGALLAGFTLSSASFIFDSVTPQKRLRCISYQNLINNFCIVSGTLFGGAVVQCIPYAIGFPADFTGSSSPILLLFFISGTMRLITLTYLISFAEVRDVPGVRSKDIMFRLITLRPFTGSQISPMLNQQEENKSADQKAYSDSQK